ncbi:MAG: hypothetical protein LUG98_15765 [Tannerellaceae bacterium]|nr:hypothetical protein [Tannerellaceae bacterium]
MKQRITISVFYLTVLFINIQFIKGQTLPDEFISPPFQARPWVYWMWINGNVNKESVTKDLEAMDLAGIGGAMVLDVDQWTPQGKLKHMSPDWIEVFSHTVKEAGRRNMEISTNNGPGYWGSGGSWVTPELGMQWVVSSETYVKGGISWKGELPNPGKGTDYKDIAVIAVGVIDTIPSKRFNIPDFAMKSLQFPGNQGEVNYACAPMTLKAIGWPGHPRYLAYRGTQSGSLYTVAPVETVIPHQKVIVLTDKMEPDGTLSWDIPEGEWTIIRFGHQFTGSCIGPVIPEVMGPETDKLSKEATRFHFNQMVKHLKEKIGPDGTNSFKSIHIDSWEGGGQNWTAGMEQEFHKRRGYDPIPYLPVLTGRILGSLQETERFLYDLRVTVSELFVENYVREMQKLANEEGLSLSFESYTTIGDDLNAANFVDVPMAEFWVPIGWSPGFFSTVKSMASAAHLNNRPIVAAEALTAAESEKWLYHPAKLKYLIDEAFCGGINRMIFHRYSAQFFEVQGPGMQMGPWGQHYERTNTWWNFSTSWHQYITRCQHMLRQGVFQADILYVMPEEPMYRFREVIFQGYDYDVLGSDSFRHLSADEQGIHYPGRPSYKLMVLCPFETMSLERLRKIYQLVHEGAVILGERPKATPGLYRYKEEAEEFRQLTQALWGQEHTDRLQVNHIGKGTVFAGIPAEEALLRINIKKDFDSDRFLKYIHRRLDDGTDIYFVANTTDTPFQASCTFRNKNRFAEIWDPETGERYSLSSRDNGVKETNMFLIPFSEYKSWFIIFPPGQQYPESDYPGSSLPPLPVHQVMKNIRPVEGEWSLHFPKGWGAPANIKLPELISWSEHPHEDIRHFSGTATYRKEISLTPDDLNQQYPLYLDLGEVEIMARLIVNGKDAGIAWRSPYRFNITDKVHIGKNSIEIEVVNLWPNRLIGDDKYPDDSNFNTHGFIEKWPDWLLKGKKRPSGRKAFTTRRLWTAEDELLPSGLLGPVHIYHLE